MSICESGHFRYFFNSYYIKRIDANQYIGCISCMPSWLGVSYFLGAYMILQKVILQNYTPNSITISTFHAVAKTAVMAGSSHYTCRLP